VIPDWPGKNLFGGLLIHAAQYRNAEPFAGLRDRQLRIGHRN
jgi:cation diffusion facilitator CzcD-associated flavoprotein CzcO